MLHTLFQLGAVTDDPNPWLLLAAAGVVAVLLLVLLWPRVRHGAGSGQPEMRSDPSLAQQRSVERDMQTLMRELSEMARKIGAQLDAKSARLEALIRAADERATRLEATARDAQPNASDTDGHPTTDASAQFESPPSSIPIPPPAQETDPRHVQIYALADEGLSAVQIAERLGRPEGEVELILALRPRGRAAV
jgi:hypothetical protein